MPITPQRWNAALTFADFVATARVRPEFWRSASRTARAPDDLVSRARALSGRWKLAVLVEDWCIDAVSVVPIVARLVDEVPGFELKVFPRDANPDLMDAHLTGSSRAIPVVMVLDEQFVEQGWWGPRPTELQAWFEAEGRVWPKEERGKHIRTWYARDRGRTALDEILRIAEGAAERVAAA